MGLFAADTVDRPPVRDRERPRANAAAGGIEPGGLAPDLDEHLLGDLLGLRRIAEDASRHAIDDRRQPVVERGERILITTSDLDHQRVEVGIQGPPMCQTFLRRCVDAMNCSP